MVSVLVLLVLLVMVVGVLGARLSASHKPPEDWFVPGFDWLKNEVRSMALLVLGGKGSGKSFAVGRDLCFRTFMDGIPQIIIDPTGGTVDHLLQKLLETAQHLSPDQQEVMWQRILYVDMAASYGRVTSFPFYVRIGTQSLYSAAQPLLDTILCLDKDLGKAPVEGKNSIRTYGSRIGMILTALGFQVSEAEDLSQNPKQWDKDGWLDEAQRRCPQAAKAVTWFKKQYSKWSPELQTRRTSSFLSKIEMYSLDPIQRAIYAGSQGIDFDTLREQGITLILDFRNVTDEGPLQFGLMWILHWFLAQIRYRGLRQQPIHFCIDELSRMTNQDSQDGNSEFSKAIDTLLSVETRNRGVYTTLMLQGLWQVDKRLQDSLLSCGNLMIGYQSDHESCRVLGKHLFPYTGQPLLKRWEKLYAQSDKGPVLTNVRPVEYTLVEAEHIAANAFQLPGFHFLVRAQGEGTMSGPVLPMVVKEIGCWVKRDEVAALRHKLAQKSGRPLEEVLAEIDQRMAQKPGDSSVTLSSDGPDGDLPSESAGADGQGVIWEVAA